MIASTEPFAIFLLSASVLTLLWIPTKPPMPVKLKLKGSGIPGLNIVLMLTNKEYWLFGSLKLKRQAADISKERNHRLSIPA